MIRLTPAMIEAIDGWAEKSGQSRSSAARELIQIGLKAKMPK